MKRENRGVTVLCLPERLKLVIPGFTQSKAEFTREHLRVASGTNNGCANRVLAQDPISYTVGLHMKDSECWGVHPPSTVAERSLVFGNLEPEMLPAK